MNIITNSKSLMNSEEQNELLIKDGDDCYQTKAPITLEQLCSAMSVLLDAHLKREGVISSPDMTKSYFVAKMSQYEREVFSCIFLDNRHQIIAYEELFFGTIDGASVYPREVVKRCLYHNAAAVIFAHNHPSGVPEPSHADEHITLRLKEALSLVDIRVLDHIIIGGSDTVSLAERGLF